jgi:octaprenyl-diphosphate synthase
VNLIAELHQALSKELESINHLILSHLAADEPMVGTIGKYLVEAGGKRIRPLLTILSSKMCGYNGENSIKLATAVEFIHAATLLHDDVVDNSLIRRFKPTANSIWGNKSTILVGDFLFSQSFKLMVATESLEALKILSKSASNIISGEVSQLIKLKEKRIISRNEYEAIISAKTAELFGAACQVGGVIASKSDEVCSTLQKFGFNLGIVFQVKDDLLDYLGKKAETGKNIADDFMEGKVTLPLIILHNRLPQKEQQQLEEILQKESRTFEEFEAVLSQMHHYQIQDYILSDLAQFKSDTEDLLKNLYIDNIYKEYLLNLLDFALSRTH